MPDSVLDLLLGSSCAACRRPGRVLCRRCRLDLPTSAETCWPTPTPPGLVPPAAAGEYAGALRLLVNAHKEQHCFALAAPLGELLAISALHHTPPPSGDRRGRPLPRPVLLVPVPSRGAVVRSRGHDPLLRITLKAASRLRRLGVPTTAVRLLRSIRKAEDQSGLGAADRLRNLAGSMACARERARRVVSAVHGEPPLVLVVDDVLTTGATVREAQRALEEADVAVTGIAVVAATRRRLGRPVDQPRTAPAPTGPVNPALLLPFSTGGH